MTPLQQIQKAAEAYAAAWERRLRMNRNNSKAGDRVAASRAREAARRDFVKLVEKHPGEVVKLFRDHKRLREGLALMFTVTRNAVLPTNEMQIARHAAKDNIETSREILP